MKRYVSKFEESNYDDLYGFNPEEEIYKNKKELEDLIKKAEIFRKALSVSLKQAEEDFKNRSKFTNIEQFQRYHYKFDSFQKDIMVNNFKGFLQKLVDMKLLPRTRGSKYIKDINILYASLHPELDDDVKLVKLVINAIDELFFTKDKGINKKYKAFPTKFHGIYTPHVK